MRRISMDRIERFIKMLDSPKASARCDACESLRVAPSLNDAAFAALERASKDPDPEVRDAAQRALDLHRTVRKTDATSWELAALSKLEQEIAELERRRLSASSQMNTYWLVAIALGLITVVLSCLLVYAESELFLVSLTAGAGLCTAFVHLGPYFCAKGSGFYSLTQTDSISNRGF
jgi:ABC-type multidrug transport system fused ATPase/permease subunit